MEGGATGSPVKVEAGANARLLTGDTLVCVTRKSRRCVQEPQTLSQPPPQPGEVMWGLCDMAKALTSLVPEMGIQSYFCGCYVTPVMSDS